MGLVEETIEAYKYSVDDYAAKHMDINVIKEEADFFLSVIDGNQILDVGCGPGRDLKYFSNKGYMATGLDLMLGFVHIARLNAPKSKVYLGDMRDMEFGDDSFDGLWSMASILHFPRSPVDEAEMVMKEYSRVLKSGGKMFLSVMKGNGVDSLSTNPKYGGHSKFFYSYGEQELQDLVESVGFKIDDFEVQEKVLTTRNPVTFLNLFATNYK